MKKVCGASGATLELLREKLFFRLEILAPIQKLKLPELAPAPQSFSTLVFKTYFFILITARAAVGISLSLRLFWQKKFF